MKSKEKGNREERKQADILGKWMFDDPKFLRKSEGSGSTKIVWTGDIVPVKLLPEIWDNKWPFNIEIKTGYNQFQPDFWNYTKLEVWMKKSLSESLLYNQNIILLITQFTHRPALLSTNYLIQKIQFSTCWPIIFNNNWIYIYTYKLKDILQYQFEDIFPISTIIQR